MNTPKNTTLNLTKYVIQPCTELANPGPRMTLSKEQLHALQKKGLVRVLAEQTSTPSISEQQTLELELPPQQPSNYHEVSIKSSSQASNKSAQVNWPISLTKKLIDIVVPKKAEQKKAEKKLKDEQFWEEVAIDLNSTMTGTQCKNKYYNLDRDRKKKKREWGSWSNGGVQREECLQYLDNALHSGEEPLEVSKEEMNDISLLYPSSPPSVEPSDDPVIDWDDDKKSVSYISYSKKSRKSFESGNNKNMLQQKWLMYLNQSSKIRCKELKFQEEKMAMRRVNLKLKQEKLALLQSIMKENKTQQEEKRTRHKKKMELMRKFVEMEGKKIQAIKDLKEAYCNNLRNSE